MKKLKYALFSALMVMSFLQTHTAFGKTYMPSTGGSSNYYTILKYPEYNLKNGYFELYIDSCVISQPVTFKENSIDSYDVTIYCRDLDDPSGTVFPLTMSNFSRDFMKGMRENPKYNETGHVHSVLFTVYAPRRDCVYKRTKKGGEGIWYCSGSMDFTKPLFKDSGTRAYVMGPEELKREYGDRLSKKTRPASSLGVYQLRNYPALEGIDPWVSPTKQPFPTSSIGGTGYAPADAEKHPDLLPKTEGNSKVPKW